MVCISSCFSPLMGVNSSFFLACWFAFLLLVFDFVLAFVLAFLLAFLVAFLFACFLASVRPSVRSCLLACFGASLIRFEKHLHVSFRAWRLRGSVRAHYHLLGHGVIACFASVPAWWIRRSLQVLQHLLEQKRLDHL